MLPQRSNTRGGPRGQSSDRSRGRGGRGRGSAPSSGESIINPFFSRERSNVPSGPRAMRDKTDTTIAPTTRNPNYLGKRYDPHFHKRFESSPSDQSILSQILAASADAFQSEREANAAKREQRGQTPMTMSRGGGVVTNALRDANGGRGRGTGQRGRGGRTGFISASDDLENRKPTSNLSIGSAPQLQTAPNTSASKPNPFAVKASSTPAAVNPFASAATTSSPFGQPSSGPAKSNPFAATADTTSLFGNVTTSSNPFGTFSQASAGGFGNPSQQVSAGVLGALSGSNTDAPNPFGGFSSHTTTKSSQLQTVNNVPFGASSTVASNPINPFAKSTTSTAPSSQAISSIGFGQPSAPPITSGTSTSLVDTGTKSPFGNSTSSPFANFVSSNSSNKDDTSTTSQSVFANITSKPPTASAAFGSRSSFSSLPTPFTQDISKMTASPFSSSSDTANLNSQQPLPPLFGGTQSINNFSTSYAGPTNPPITSSPFNTGFSGISQVSNKPSPTVTPTLRNPLIQSNNPRSLSSSQSPFSTSEEEKDPYAEKIAAHLKQVKVYRPTPLSSDPGDPRMKPAVDKIYTKLKEYRDSARTALQQAGLIDDPKKPKHLKDAIDFRGTCQTKCTLFEMYERISEGITSIHRMEQRIGSDGQLRAAADLMVTRHGRSAAGEDSPLPEDIRTPQTCRRTVDYLFTDVLGGPVPLRTSHSFLWDRTRQIRREFIFQTALTRSEHSDHVYCLEQIARFHMVAMHQMCKDGAADNKYSAQQEGEQLAKTLHSLIEAYGDCEQEGIDCPNAPEFKACFALYHAHNSNILEDVHGWGPEVLATDEMSTAVFLIEALQNTFDLRGPQRPYSTTDIALNTFTTFFDIVEDENTSYTMACLAEVHFNRVRLSALRTILASFRKQRDQTKEWTVSKLNEWLRFDDESEVITFGEAYKLRFDVDDQGEQYLSFENNSIKEDIFPPPKQRFSQSLVERKRGSSTLVELVKAPVYESFDEPTVVANGLPTQGGSVKYHSTPSKAEDEAGLFVPDNTLSSGAPSAPASLPPPPSTFGFQLQPQVPQHQMPQQLDNKAIDSSGVKASDSVLSKVSATNNIGSDFFKIPTAASTSLSTPPNTTSAFAPAAVLAPPTGQVTPQNADSKTTSPFSFLKPFTSQSTGVPKITPSSGNHVPEGAPVVSLPSASTGFFGALGSQSAVSAPVASTTIQPTITNSTPPFTHGSSLSSLTNVPPMPAITNSPPKDTGLPSLTAPTVAPDSSFAQAATTADRERKVDNVVKWYFHGEEGILEQYTQFKIEDILKDAFEIVQDEIAEREAHKLHDAAIRTADTHRLQHISSKYVRFWRNKVERIKVRRNREVARKRREEMAAAARSKQMALSQNLLEDFTAATKSVRNQKRGDREGSLESLLNAPSANSAQDSIDLSHGENHSLNRRHSERILRQPRSRSTTRTDRDTTQSSHRSSHQSIDLGRSGVRRSRLDNPLRRSLADYPEAFNGGSRLNLTKDYASDRRQISGVQTDYFRLKARGIHTMPDGSPLASSVANALRKKRSYEDVSREDPWNTSAGYDRVRNMSKNTYDHTEIPTVRGANSAIMDPTDEIERLKARARKIVEKDDRRIEDEKSSKKRRSVDLMDEDLLERVKRVKAQLDEGSAWYRKCLENDAMERLSGTGSYGSG